MIMNDEKNEDFTSFQQGIFLFVRTKATLFAWEVCTHSHYLKDSEF